jgi:hypothetical protein
VPDQIVQNYVLSRYQKASWCDYPFGKKDDFPKTLNPVLPKRSYQNIQAMTNYYIPQEKRKEWLAAAGSINASELNKEIPNVDQIEVDNTIASAKSCQMDGGLLKVIGWNAERGTYWAEFATMVESMPTLEKPDLIILNEMDIGMVRSGNIHTARKLAFRLGMNYAWGLEFVELTNGNREEQKHSEGSKNRMGLHGNAILSSCPIFDPILVRDPLDERYFSGNFKGNDMGSERRLGGRMAIFARTGNISTASLQGMDDVEPGNLTRLTYPPHVIAGSVHKVMPTTQRGQIWDYLGFGRFPSIGKKEYPAVGTAPSNVRGIVTAGDMESRSFCPE